MVKEGFANGEVREAAAVILMRWAAAPSAAGGATRIPARVALSNGAEAAGEAARPSRGDLQIYLVRRAPQLAFMGGFHVFPGGAVDREDGDVPILNAPTEARFCVAALRELLEETGVLVGVNGACEPSADARIALRRKLVRTPTALAAVGPRPHGAADSVAAAGTSHPSGAMQWIQGLAQRGWALDGSVLLPMGQWLTPAYSPIRFFARYYGVWLPPGQEPEIWEGELIDGSWLTPAEALAQHGSGCLFIPYPVLETVKALADALAGDPSVRSSRPEPCAVTQAAQRMEARGVEAYPHAGGEMISGVHMVPLRTYTLPPATHTNCYVLGRDELVVVDPATPIEAEQERLLQYLSHLRGQGARLLEIWLTHQHADHVGAVSRLRAEFGLRVAAHRLTAAALQAAGGPTVDRYIEDGDVQRIACAPAAPARWRALHTPGHAAGHLCFYEEGLGSLLSGDNVLGMGTVLIAPPEGDMAAYMTSLSRLHELDLGILFPAHGPPIATAKDRISMYIDHRRERERAIFACLDNPLDVGEIARLVYSDVPAAALPLAELNVRAHLNKLEAEGRVRQHLNRFERIDSL